MRKVMTLFLVAIMMLNIFVIPISAAERNSTKVNHVVLQTEEHQDRYYALKIRSVDELELYLTRYIENSVKETIEAIKDKYNEHFFEENVVLFVYVKPSPFYVTSVTENETCIQVEIESYANPQPMTYSCILSFDMERDMPEKEIWINSKKFTGTPYKTLKFDDVPENTWYTDAVYNLAWDRGLMTGTGSTTFEPEKNMTRGMLVTVLWRYYGEPVVETKVFSDVPDGKYYTQAVNWAAVKGIVTGIGNGKFNPEGEVTREQMVTIMYRFFKTMGCDMSGSADFSNFADDELVREYAKKAMEWAVAKGIILGSEKNGIFYLKPQNGSTRAQFATVFQRSAESMRRY